MIFPKIGEVVELFMKVGSLMKIASTLAEFSVEPDGTVRIFVSLAVILIVALAVAVTAIASKKARSENVKNDVEPKGPAPKFIQEILDDPLLDDRVNPSRHDRTQCNRDK